MNVPEGHRTTRGATRNIPGERHFVQPSGTTVCRVCGDEGAHRTVRAREMMFGTREAHDYFWCERCDCLQIAEIPANLERHYPPDRYYACQGTPRRRGLAGRLKRARDRAVMGDRALLGRALTRLVPYPPDGGLRAVARISPPHDARILDVGCGAGQLLRDLAGVGYRDLVGVDPHVRADGAEGSGIRIVRGTIEDVRGPFDLVMLHHVLEHVPDPSATLRAVGARLASAGECLVRVPVFPSEAWDRYGPDWVQLDPPRHIHVPGRRTLEMMAEVAGLEIVETWNDSTHFQFTGSEGYQRDVPLVEQEEPGRRARQRGYREAVALNAAGRGDQIAVRLRAR